jgi:amidase
VTRHLLERIARHNPRLNAIVTLTSDTALARAKAADEARARGDWWGPLHGVPCTIKDSFSVAGVRTTAGAPQWATYTPTQDAVAVARLRGAGAVFLGRTNVPTMLSDWQSVNPIFGATNNPWDVARTPGGSSGGCAAALAAGLSYLSLGSDIGGSLRVPAHFCGIFSHKPTLNVVPLRGQIPPAPGTVGPPPTLPVAGPLARSATDLLLALQVLGGPDGDDARGYRWTLPPARGAQLTDYRVGYVLDDPHCPLSADVGDVHARSIDALRKAGARLEEGWPDGVKPDQQDKTYRSLLFAALGLASPSLQEYRAAGRERIAARAAWQAYFRTHDAFLLPTAFVAAFPHDHSPMSSRTLATPAGARRYLDLLFWISFATLTGLPATVAPVGLTRDGLPVGLQVIGPYLEDATPIDVAGRIADVLGGFRRPPAL